MTETLTLPPQMYGEAVDGDPIEHAVLRALQGCDAGLLTYRITADRMGAALVFAPEVPLSSAAVMFPLCGVGFQNALGALAPPEVAVHLGWNGALLINGALCGRLRGVAACLEPRSIPDWLVVGFTLPLMSLSGAPGVTPDQTALFEEGCADVAPLTLIEAWARHTLNWISRWEADGVKPLHNEWRGLAAGIGEDISLDGQDGTFLGVDEDFGLLMRQKSGTRIIPVSHNFGEMP